MGVTILPDWGPELGKALEGLGHSVAEIKDPYFDFHNQLRQAMATNPDILEKLAGNAYVSGGLSAEEQKLLPKDVVTQINTRTSNHNVLPQFIKQRAGRDVAAAASVDALTPPSGFTKQEWHDLGRSSISGESIEGAASGFANAPVAPTVAQSTLDTANMKIDERRALYSYLSQHPEDRDMVMAMGGAEGLRFIEGIKKDKEMLELRNGAELQRWREEQRDTVAKFEAERLNVSLEDMQSFLYDPDALRRAHDRAARGETTEADSRLLHVEQAVRERDLSRDAALFHRIQDGIRTSENELITKTRGRKITPDVQAQLVSSINDNLSYYNALKGTNIRAYYGNLYDLKAIPEPRKAGKGEMVGERRVGLYEANTLHYVSNPGSPNAQVIDPQNLGALMTASAGQANSNNSNSSTNNPNPNQGGGATTVSQARPVTQAELLQIKDSRWHLEYDKLKKAGVPDQAAIQRATQLVDSLYR